MKTTYQRNKHAINYEHLLKSKMLPHVCLNLIWNSFSCTSTRIYSEILFFSLSLTKLITWKYYYFITVNVTWLFFLFCFVFSLILFICLLFCFVLFFPPSRVPPSDESQPVPSHLTLFHCSNQRVPPPHKIYPPPIRYIPKIN